MPKNNHEKVGRALSKTRTSAVRTVVASFLAALLITGCSGTGTAPTNASGEASGGQFRVGYVGGSGADVIDPILTSGTPDIIRMRQMYDTLTRVNEAGEVVPWLAEEITEETPERWTIKLREDVLFHDGTTMTADDVVFSLQRLLSPESSNASQLHMLEPEGIKAIDEYTVELTLSTPAYYLPEALNMWAASIVPEDFDPSEPVGTGPFKLESFTPGQQVVFSRFDDYFEEPAKVDEVVISTFTDEAARVTALQGGQLDHAPLLSSTYATVIENDDRLQIHQYPTGRFENFVLHSESPEFEDPRVRQAMRLLMDRQEILDQAYGGMGRVANDVPEPSGADYNDSLPQWEQDVDAAKELLAEANAESLSLELITAPLTPTTVGAAEVYVQQLSDAGLDVEIRQIDAGEFYGPAFGERTFTQDIWGGWTFGTFVAMTQLDFSSFNETHWNNEEFVAEFEAASATIDPAERQQHLHRAQEIMHTESGTVIPVFQDVLDVYSTSAQNFSEEPLGVGAGDFDYRAITLN